MFTPPERTALIRLASVLPPGGKERIAVLSTLKSAAVQGKFYLFSPAPLEALEIAPFGHLDWNDPSSAALPVSDGSRYVGFKKWLSNDSFSRYTNNYIYEIRTPISLFDGSERDCYRLFKSGFVDMERFNRYWGEQGSSDPVSLAQFLAKKIKGPMFGMDLPNTLGITTANFKKLFNGVHLRNSSQIFVDVIKAHAVLVDGLSKRTDTGPKEENQIVFPNWVLDELTRYTDDASKRMKAGVLEWLMENSPKPYANRRVYRGFGTQIDDFGDYSKLTLALVNKQLFSRTGIRDIGQVRVGGKITVKRGKESSWSASPQVAMNFASGMAEKTINFLVKAEVSASRVVIDFTELPTTIRKSFKYHGQAEVIVSPGPTEGVLSTLWLDKKFIAWLDSHGYDFVPQRGIFKR